MTSHVPICRERFAEVSSAETRLGIRDTITPEAIGVLEVRVIENVEEIALELERNALRDLEALRQTQGRS